MAAFLTAHVSYLLRHQPMKIIIDKIYTFLIFTIPYNEPRVMGNKNNEHLKFGAIKIIIHSIIFIEI